MDQDGFGLTETPCLCQWSSGIKGVCQHAQLKILLNYFEMARASGNSLAERAGVGFQKRIFSCVTLPPPAASCPLSNVTLETRVAPIHPALFSDSAPGLWGCSCFPLQQPYLVSQDQLWRSTLRFWGRRQRQTVPILARRLLWQEWAIEGLEQGHFKGTVPLSFPSNIHTRHATLTDFHLSI